MGPHAAQRDEHVSNGQIDQVIVDGGAQCRIVVNGHYDGAISQDRHDHVDDADGDFNSRNEVEGRRPRSVTTRVVVFTEIELQQIGGVAERHFVLQFIFTAVGTDHIDDIVDDETLHDCYFQSDLTRPSSELLKWNRQHNCYILHDSASWGTEEAAGQRLTIVADALNDEVLQWVLICTAAAAASRQLTQQHRRRLLLNGWASRVGTRPLCYAA